QAHRALRHAPLSLRCAANYALDAPERYRLCTNVQAARSRAAARCSLYEQSGEANEVLCGKSGISPQRRRDRVSVWPQHTSYTNKMVNPREAVGMIGAFSTAGLFMTDATVAGGDKIRCDACPVMCYIKPGAAGACDRYANHNGELARVDPHIVLEQTVSHGGRLVPFQRGGDWDGKLVQQGDVFVTAIGAGTTYPDYKPAPFI